MKERIKSILGIKTEDDKEDYKNILIAVCLMEWAICIGTWLELASYYYRWGR